MAAVITAGYDENVGVTMVSSFVRSSVTTALSYISPRYPYDRPCMNLPIALARAVRTGFTITSPPFTPATTSLAAEIVR